MLQSRGPESVPPEVELELFGTNPEQELFQSTSSASDFLALAAVLKKFGLEGLPRLANLEVFARKWGVVSIRREPIESDAMLFGDGSGFTMVINSLKSRGNPARQRFSFAHELGHLLLQLAGLSKYPRSVTQHRLGNAADQKEEQLCDQIAAEILMPALAFEEDGWMLGWSLRSLRELCDLYGTSMEATARRMINLMRESCVFSLWHPATANGGNPTLSRVYPEHSSQGVSADFDAIGGISGLLASAVDSGKVESGVVSVKDNQSGRVVRVPAEALTWGQDYYRRIVVFHYPERSEGNNE